MNTYGHGQALACYLNAGDIPVGASYVRQFRPTGVVYLVLSWGAR